MFLKTVEVGDATGQIATLYAREVKERGFVMEATRCWTTRPDLLAIQDNLSEAIKANFSLGMRNWRLITLIAAKFIPSTYCSQVYAQMLIADLGSREAVMALHRDYRQAGLSEKDVAMLAYAEQIARSAKEVTDDDILHLKTVGFTDIEIADIAVCVAFRFFFSRYVDAVGAVPEPAFLDADPVFREEMTVGRPLPETA